MSVAVLQMSELDFRKTLGKTRKAIIPVGSLEQHGAHLPVSTDSLIAQHLATRVAENVGAYVLPVIPYGVSFEHKPMFNVSIKNLTLTRMLRDTCISLADNEIKDIFILNGHYGNKGAIQNVVQELKGKLPADASVHTIHYWHMLSHEFDHAGEVETSLVLAIMPKLVRMERAEPNSKRLGKSKAAYGSMINAPGSFPKITGNGVWGDPRRASAEKGKKWILEITSNLCKAIDEL